MKQVIQSYRTGELWLAEVPAPAMRSGGGAIVHTAASLVSAGTERMIIELARKSLLGKARARPDLVKRVISKIKTEGISPTLEKVFAKLDTPIPLGYSSAGTVVEVGAGMSGLKPGDRVACGGAGYATHAELNYVPKNLLATVPDGVSFEDASFTTVGAIAMQGVRQADVRIGERVAVVGLGLIGLLTVQILKAAGCLVLGHDPDAGKCQLATALGADEAVSSDLIGAAEALSQGHGVDAVIITAATSSNEPIEQAAEILRTKGRVVVVGMVGMDVPREPFYKKELDLRLSMSYGPGRYDSSYEETGHDYPIGYVRWTEQRNMASFLDLMAAGKVTPTKVVTHRFAIDEALHAYELLEKGGQPYLGIVITYPDAHPIPGRAPSTVDLRPVTAQPGQVALAFIGAGNFARSVLIPTLKRIGGIELAGICTATGASATETAKKHGFAYATTDYQKLLGDPGIRAVFVTTRHDTHSKFACEALLAGKHVFVEKPLCIRPEQIGEYECAIEQGGDGRCVMIGFNRRFSPHTQAIRDVFASRRTPMVVTYRINAAAVPGDSWLQDAEVGGGRIIGEVCHFVDWCESVINSIPISVQAESIATHDVRIRAEDSLAANIRYADGSLATIQYISLGSPASGKERIEVFAEGKTAIVDDFTATTFHGVRRATLKTRQDKGFTGELIAFLTAIEKGGQAPLSFASVSRTTRVTFAILDALRSGTTQSIEA